jgi:hypothetical protein
MLPIATALLGGLLAKGTAGGHGDLAEILGAIAGGGGVRGAVKGFASKILGSALAFLSAAGKRATPVFMSVSRRIEIATHDAASTAASTEQ